jgi:ABC-type nitrate/sulfonate/bicarbonate transport system ATPase subunit
MRLDIENLSVSYGEQEVLKDINLQVEKLCTVTMLGSSGTGKSTFLRILSGLANRDNQDVSGKVDFAGLSPAEFLKTGDVGFMFQEPSLLPHLTVSENIHLPLKLRHADSSYAEYLIEQVGLSAYRDRLPRDLSGGMKTRVALARTLAPKPRLLLLDEPFSALDVAWRFRLYRELAKLQAEIPTVTVLVTHDIQEALLLSNRILVLGNSGTIVRDMNLSESPLGICSSDPIGHLQNEFKELHKFFINEKDSALN